MLHPRSGRFLEVYSNQPALQLYTGNDFPEIGKLVPEDVGENVKFILISLEFHCFLYHIVGLE